jgi:uncharacterized protein (DUF1499 family)
MRRAENLVELGVRQGRLARCPDSPNCVCTQASDPRHAIEPLAFRGSAAAAIARVKQAIATLPRLTIVEESGDYLRVEAVTFLFRFVDDVEFFVDEAAGVIHFRSSSRLGYSDLGANRRRMERVRAAFNNVAAAHER